MRSISATRRARRWGRLPRERTGVTVEAPTEHAGGVEWSNEYAVVGGARHAEDAMPH